MKFIYTTLILVFGFISANGQSKKVLNSWLGNTEQQIIKQWGPPTKAVSDGGQGKILVYTNDFYMPGNQYMRAISYTDFTYIYVNESGKIYSWKTERKPTVPSQVDLNLR